MVMHYSLQLDFQDQMNIWEEWINSVDRGGLLHVNQMFSFFMKAL